MAIGAVCVCWIAAIVRIQTTLIRGPRLRARVLLTGAMISLSFAETFAFLPHLADQLVPNMSVYLSSVGLIITAGLTNAYADALSRKSAMLRLNVWIGVTALVVGVLTVSWTLDPSIRAFRFEGNYLTHGPVTGAATIFYLCEYLPVLATLPRVTWVAARLPRSEDLPTRTGLGLIITAMVIGTGGYSLDAGTVIVHAANTHMVSTMQPYNLAQGFKNVAVLLLVVGVALMAGSPTISHEMHQHQLRQDLMSLWIIAVGQYPDVRLPGRATSTRMMVEIMDALRRTRCTPPMDQEEVIPILCKAIREGSTQGSTTAAAIVSTVPAQEDLLVRMSQALSATDEVVYAQ